MGFASLRALPMPNAARLSLSILLAAAVFFFFGIVAQAPDRHESDFYSFWAGSRLLGPDLYNPKKIEALQHSVSPQVTGKSFIRPPFYALALHPLGQLSFPVAFVLWQILNIAAILVGVGLWRFRPSSFIAAACFAPCWSCFRLSQDAPLLLLMAVSAAILIQRHRELFGGAVLALFVVKPNLVPLIPFLLLVQRRYRALSGFFAAGMALYLISSLAMGFNWLVGYTRSVLGNEGTISPRIPGLGGLFTMAGAPQWLVYLAIVFGAALVYRYARHADWMYAFAYTLAVAVVFAPRSMMYDLVLLLPLLLLYFTPSRVVLLGLALITVVFAHWEIVGQLTAIAIAWITRPRSAPLATISVPSHVPL